MRRAFVIGCNCLCNCSPGKTSSSQTHRRLFSSKAQYSCPANTEHPSLSFSPSLTPSVSLCSLYLSISHFPLSPQHLHHLTFSLFFNSSFSVLPIRFYPSSSVFFSSLFYLLHVFPRVCRPVFERPCERGTGWRLK